MEVKHGHCLRGIDQEQVEWMYIFLVMLVLWPEGIDGQMNHFRKGTVCSSVECVGRSEGQYFEKVWRCRTSGETISEDKSEIEGIEEERQIRSDVEGRSSWPRGRRRTGQLEEELLLIQDKGDRKFFTLRHPLGDWASGCRQTDECYYEIVLCMHTNCKIWNFFFSIVFSSFFLSNSSSVNLLDEFRRQPFGLSTAMQLLQTCKSLWLSAIRLHPCLFFFIYFW